eukprot:scaffold23939_cov68-Phaeocystis_antarctica.AAC.3
MQPQKEPRRGNLQARACVPASFLPGLQPASLTSRPNGYAPNLLDRLAALSSIERLPLRRA